MEMNAVSTICTRGLGLSGAALALVLLGFGAVAQTTPQTGTAPKATTTAKKQPACKTVKAQAGCEERTDCSWVAESKDANGKVKAKAYCRTKPKGK
jgi:hypothetical protein